MQPPYRWHHLQPRQRPAEPLVTAQRATGVDSSALVLIIGVPCPGPARLARPATPPHTREPHPTPAATISSNVTQPRSQLFPNRGHHPPAHPASATLLSVPLSLTGTVLVASSLKWTFSSWYYYASTEHCGSWRVGAGKTCSFKDRCDVPWLFTSQLCSLSMQISQGTKFHIGDTSRSAGAGTAASGLSLAFTLCCFCMSLSWLRCSSNESQSHQMLFPQLCQGGSWY